MGFSAKEGVNMFWSLNNYSSIPFLLFAFHCSSDCWWNKNAFFRV